ncbi:MAG: isoleucine--tRNA ligase [Actinomycetota bacterium]|nr:isoleucine--tRNA ligase [Actinomycetota bacterium]
MTPQNAAFKRVEPSVRFPDVEQGVIEFWRKTDAFAESVRRRPEDNEYVFYDGPPFPTGSPHYGNLLAGVIKDMVPRYWTMRGYRVERRFGWDTHGLPIEMEVEKRLGISGPTEIAEYGVDRFNEACRMEVQSNTETWEVLTERIGRWVDFKNDYRTMDPEFMETVWWVFKQLWDKGLIYKDFKVLPYSYGATTPLSNFEANLDYRDTEDPSITVRLDIVEGNQTVETGDRLVIWTTTPWTLPGNLAVAVGSDIEYARVADNGDHYWIATERAATVFGEDPLIVSTARGSDLLGAGYEPPFGYFEEERDRGAFRIIESEDVTTEEGTGLVHMAPAYGEADFVAIQNAGLSVMVDPVDPEGSFTHLVPDVAGQNIKEADKELIRLLSESGKLVKSSRINHSYPFCYRTGTPLIYKAIPTWFVAVESFKDRMVELNEQVHWVPSHVGQRRFGNWLAGARDWAISRNRYWGSCIPIWECDECTEQTAIGSLDELEALSGQRPADLHSHIIDKIQWDCSSCDGEMVRVPEVLDCWFESGAMPYGKLHYPFENKERFDSTYPAQFIAEGLDQTRGWFYTLMVLSTALFDTPAFQNCVVNGLILAEDGRKMSKSLKNYTDPSEIFDELGADALRAFLINSPVLRAEPLRFSKEGVAEVVRTVLLPMWNTYSFFTTYAEADGITIADLQSAPAVEDRPEMDRWILSVLQSLIEDVNTQMEGYYLYNVVPPTLGFIDHLTNWYVRRSRRRFWRSRGESGTGDADKLAAFATLYEVLTRFMEVLAPVLPFITEHVYQDLVARHHPEAPTSVHHRDFPVSDDALIDAELETSMAHVREVVRLGRNLRKKEGHRVRQPLARLTILTRDDAVAAAVDEHRDIISDELNVREVEVSADEGALVNLSAKADFRKLGPVLGSGMGEAAKEIAGFSSDDVERLLDGGTIELADITIGLDEVIIERTAVEGTIVETGPEFACALDTTLTEELLQEGLAREIVSRVQNLRRESGLQVSDRINLAWFSEASNIDAAIVAFGDHIAGEVLAETVIKASEAAGSVFNIDGTEVWLEVSPS